MVKHLEKLFSNFRCPLNLLLILPLRLSSTYFHFITDSVHNISSCSLYEKSVNRISYINSNLCQAVSHLKCNNLNYVDGPYLKSLNISCYCWAFCADMFPFTNINSYKLYLPIIIMKRNILKLIKMKHVLKPQKNLSDLFKEILKVLWPKQKPRTFLKLQVLWLKWNKALEQIK